MLGFMPRLSATGIQKDKPETMIVNVRMLDGFDEEDITEIKKVDGRNF